MFALALLAAITAFAAGASSPPYKLATFNWADRYKPIAAEGAIYMIGSTVRVSVLKEAVVRLEYSASGVFDDSATLAVLNRRFDVPKYTTEQAGSVHTIETASLRITYDSSAALGVGLSASNTIFELLVAPHSKFYPGAPQKGNMHGTFRTLDRVGDPIDLACPAVTSFYVYYCHCEEGLASKDGWVILDDTLRPRMDLDAGESGVPWPRAPPAAALKNDGSYQDFYVLARGLDYKGAMGDFKDLSGTIPLSPRWALGPAFSRWFQWNDAENLAIVQAGFADHGIPLDTLVVDMDWCARSLQMSMWDGDVGGG